ncbi:MAG TPA: hypothetical protein VFZ91_07100, partial [Allosphingosinicella sp.]
MATGTEGNDNLTNDPSNGVETIDALGGDDVITIQPGAPGAYVVVKGGSGYDTLILNDTVHRMIVANSSGYDGTIWFRHGMSSFFEVNWTSIERLELTGILSPASTNVFGEEVDILRFGTAPAPSEGIHTITTNGGNDEIYLSGQPVYPGASVVVNSGTGADIVDFSGITVSGAGTGFCWTADGGDGNDTLKGSSFRDALKGDAGNDNLHLYLGGDDVAEGGAGLDNFFFGAALTAADVVTGGADADTLVIQGDYPGGVTLSANITQIENVSILAGSNTAFGEPGTNRYDYVLTTNDANFAAGVQARINGAALLEGEDFTFNGSAETDASYVVYGGKGRDTLLGGLGNDIFFYAEERFASGDTVNGGPGYDGMFLRGNYTIDFNAPGYTGLFTNIE